MNTNDGDHRYRPSFNSQITKISPNPTPISPISQFATGDNQNRNRFDILRFSAMPRSITATATETKTTVVGPSSSPSAIAIDGSEEDAVLSRSKTLTRSEVIRRRSRRLKQLADIYKDNYWAMMEELKAKYREYWWKHGKSPFHEDEGMENANRTRGTGGGGGEENELGLASESNQCAVHGCKSKAMALTRFCHTHILSDAKQKLYKGCDYPIKSTHRGPILCGKPILRSSIPALCSSHWQMAEKNVAMAMKKAGLNVSSTSKLAPKLHVIVAEYVRQIQRKRRDALKATQSTLKEEENSFKVLDTVKI